MIHKTQKQIQERQQKIDDKINRMLNVLTLIYDKCQNNINAGYSNIIAMNGLPSSTLIALKDKNIIKPTGLGKNVNYIWLKEKPSLIMAEDIYDYALKINNHYATEKKNEKKLGKIRLGMKNYVKIIKSNTNENTQEKHIPVASKPSEEVVYKHIKKLRKALSKGTTMNLDGVCTMLSIPEPLQYAMIVNDCFIIKNKIINWNIEHVTNELIVKLIESRKLYNDNMPEIKKEEIQIVNTVENTNKYKDFLLNLYEDHLKYGHIFSLVEYKKKHKLSSNAIISIINSNLIKKEDGKRMYKWVAPKPVDEIITMFMEDVKQRNIETNKKYNKSKDNSVVFINNYDVFINKYGKYAKLFIMLIDEYNKNNKITSLIKYKKLIKGINSNELQVLTLSNIIEKINGNTYNLLISDELSDDLFINYLDKLQEYKHQFKNKKSDIATLYTEKSKVNVEDVESMLIQDNNIEIDNILSEEIINTDTLKTNIALKLIKLGKLEEADKLLAEVIK